MEKRSEEKVLNGLRRVRSQLCRFYRKEHEVHKCPCVRGGHDAGHENGAETGCKEIMDAINIIQEKQ